MKPISTNPCSAGGLGPREGEPVSFWAPCPSPALLMSCGSGREVCLTKVSPGRVRAKQRAAWHCTRALGWGHAELPFGPNPSQQVRSSGKKGTRDGLDQGWRKLTKLQSKGPGPRKEDWAWGHTRRYRRTKTG